MWVDPTLTLPVDGQTVFVRRLLYSGQTPRDAIYRSASVSFEMPNGQLLPWQFVAVWKPR